MSGAADSDNEVVDDAAVAAAVAAMVLRMVAASGRPIYCNVVRWFAEAISVTAFLASARPSSRGKYGCVDCSNAVAMRLAPTTQPSGCEK